VTAGPARGVLVPLVTPLDDDGSVSRTGVASLVATVAPYVDALVPALGSGEGWVLDDQQWQDMVAATVSNAAGLAVLPGLLRPTTAEVLALAGRAAELGARAVVASTPFGADVTQEQMYRHYADIAAHSPVPVVVYHESETSGNLLAPETLLRVWRLPGVVAVKDSTGDLDATRDLIAAGVPVLQGGDHLMGAGLPVDGFLVSLANLEPRLCAQMWRAPDAGTAELIAKKCVEHDLFADDWYRAIKRRLYERGVIANPRPVTRQR
jgi:4-hydroxy-tetrahydrodipicolinate synthase